VSKGTGYMVKESEIGLYTQKLINITKEYLRRNPDCLDDYTKGLLNLIGLELDLNTGDFVKRKGDV
jgi:hypothetical protein